MKQRPNFWLEWFPEDEDISTEVTTGSTVSAQISAAIHADLARLDQLPPDVEKLIVEAWQEGYRAGLGQLIEVEPDGRYADIMLTQSLLGLGRAMQHLSKVKGL